MSKMHLGAHAPSEGARRLAGWMARECRGVLAVAGHSLGIEPARVQSMLSGDLLPGDEIGEPLFHRAKIDRLLFQRPATGEWFADASR